MEISISLKLWRVMCVDQKKREDAGSVLCSEVGQGNSRAFLATDLLLPERGGFMTGIEGMEGVKNI